MKTKVIKIYEHGSVDVLQIEENEIRKKIKDVELKNTLLSEKLDYDYIDMLIRDKLMLGKKGETTYIIVDNEG